MNKILPIVVVGKNRTLMTQEVIKSMNEKILDTKTFFIHVSDRSENGHIESIKNFFEINKINGIVLQTNEKRYGLGSAMNIGLESAFKISDVCLLIENDWLLRDKISFNDDIETIKTTNISNISYKHINAICNIDVIETVENLNEYYIKLYRNNGNNSFNIELGCMLVSKRLFDEIGFFTENEDPPTVEKDFINNYNKYIFNEHLERKILSANNKKYYHTTLNSPYCVFYHIGMNSSHGGVWKIPREYEYLSNIENDKIECSKFLKCI